MRWTSSPKWARWAEDLAEYHWSYKPNLEKYSGDRIATAYESSTLQKTRLRMSCKPSSITATMNDTPSGLALRQGLRWLLYGAFAASAGLIVARGGW